MAWHLFKQCEFALECWDLSGFREKLEERPVVVDSLAELFLAMVRDLDNAEVGNL